MTPLRTGRGPVLAGGVHQVVTPEIDLAVRQLSQAGIPSPRREALLIWSELFGTTPGAVLTGSKTAAPEAIHRFREAVTRRAAGEPRAYVVGTVGFRRLVLRSDRRALIPRPETEGLIDLALAHAPQGNALDLGTGSGCLALALADEGGYVEVTGVDCSGDALELARWNGREAGLKVRWEQGFWTEPVVGERFDVILANPPYIATSELPALDRSVSDWEPVLALDGGPDGLEAIRHLGTAIPTIVADGGWLFMEVDSTRAQAAAELIGAAGWGRVRLLDDLYRRPRYLAAQWESHHAR